MQILGLFLAGLAAGPVCPMVQASNLPFIAEVPVAPRDGGTIANAKAGKPVIVKVYCESTREACEEDLKRHVERAIHGPARLMSTAVERMRANPMPRVRLPSKRVTGTIKAIAGIHQAMEDDAKSMKTLAEQARVGPVQALDEYRFKVQLTVDGQRKTREDRSLEDIVSFVSSQMYQGPTTIHEITVKSTGRVEALWAEVSIGAAPTSAKTIRARLWYLGPNRTTGPAEVAQAHLILEQVGVRVESTERLTAGTFFDVRCPVP